MEENQKMLAKMKEQIKKMQDIRYRYSIFVNVFLLLQ